MTRNDAHIDTKDDLRSLNDEALEVRDPSYDWQNLDTRLEHNGTSMKTRGLSSNTHLSSDSFLTSDASLNSYSATDNSNGPSIFRPNTGHTIYSISLQFDDQLLQNIEWGALVLEELLDCNFPGGDILPSLEAVGIMRCFDSKFYDV